MKMTAIALLATIGCTALAMDKPTADPKYPSLDPMQAMLMEAQKIGGETTKLCIKALENMENLKDRDQRLLEELKQIKKEYFKTVPSRETLASLRREYSSLHEKISECLSRLEFVNPNYENAPLYQCYGRMALTTFEIKREDKRRFQLLVEQGLTCY